MTDLISETELDARRLLQGIDRDDLGQAAVKVAFTSMWYAAITPTRVSAVASAIGGFAYSAEELQPALTKMTKAKILRSRKDRGVRLYEVNY